MQPGKAQVKPAPKKKLTIDEVKPILEKLELVAEILTKAPLKLQHN